MKLRVLLVDDEPLALRGLQLALADEADIEILGLCEDGAAAIVKITELKPDIVFLDIHMPELSGFDVIDAIGLTRMPFVIFVTAFDHFAVRAFDVHALDYVLKPLDPERLQQALQKARQACQQRSAGQQTSPTELHSHIAQALKAMGIATPSSWTKRLAIKHNGRLKLFEVTELNRIEAAGNYVEVFIRMEAGVKTYLLRESLTSMEHRLNPRQFARVSRSSLVNLEQVRELQNMFNGDFIVVLRDGSQVSGSRRYRQSLETALA